MSTAKFSSPEDAFAKADEAIKSADYDLKGGFFAATANRTYYTCYYCMTALLYTKSIYPKTHSGAGTKFIELFIKTSIFPAEMANSIAILFNYRQAADYDLGRSITKKEAEDLVYKALEFYKATNDYFKNIIDSRH